jgi:BlaI family penicillinase repressor
MKSTPKISETEWEVMKIVWSHAPCSAGQIIDHLHAEDPSWHPKTVKTLLGRLVKKGALDFKKEGRAYLYRPLVKEKQCVDAVSKSFLHRFFDGSLKPMLAHFVERRKLTSTEVRELKRLLEENE